MYQSWDLERLMKLYEVRQNFPDQGGQRFISLAIQGRSADVISTAKEIPGGVNAAGTEGLTPLMVAVMRLNLPMVNALLAAGANPNGTPKNVPLHYAVRAYDLTIAKTLVAAGADPNGLPGSEPPLSEAALINYREGVDFLLRAGARIDAEDSSGETPAMTAGAAQHIDMVNYLLDRGASIWVASQFGYTVPNLGGVVCLRSEGTDAECDRLIRRIKAAHYPWPPPTRQEVKALMDEGKWPPKEALER